MGYSITCFKDKQIMSKDYKIEIWLRLICKEIESMHNTPEWLCNAQGYWAEHVDITILMDVLTQDLTIF